jgi:hypothetical protein
MSRKGQEIMSMDAQYMSEDWVFSRPHLGLMNCSYDTGGVSLFKKARRLLRRKKMLSKVSGKLFCVYAPTSCTLRLIRYIDFKVHMCVNIVGALSCEGGHLRKG